MLSGFLHSTATSSSPFRGASSSTTVWGSLRFLLPKRSRQTHLVVVSTSPDRPELDLPPVKTRRDEDRKLAPVASRELQSRRSQAQHQRGRQNIKQEPGRWGQRQPATPYPAEPRREAGTFQEATHPCPALSGSCPSPGTGSLLALWSELGPSIIQVWGWWWRDGSFPWGLSALHLVLSRPQAGSRVSSREERV